MRSPLAQASRILLHFDIAAVPSKLCGGSISTGAALDLRASFVDFIAPRSRELLASRREVLQTLTSRRYSPSLAAVGLCRESTYVFGPSGRRSAGLTKTYAEICRAKSCSSAGPSGEPLPGYDKNLLRKMKMVPLPVGAWPNCLPARAIGRTDRLRRFAVCLCRESTYAFGPSGRRSASTNKDSCRGTTSPLRGMGSFAGQKVVHALARRRALPR